jgi:hypothetical protein
MLCDSNANQMQKRRECVISEGEWMVDNEKWGGLRDGYIVKPLKRVESAGALSYLAATTMRQCTVG